MNHKNLINEFKTELVRHEITIQSFITENLSTITLGQFKHFCRNTCMSKTRESRYLLRHRPKTNFIGLF